MMRNLLLYVAAALILSACQSTGQAPVEDRDLAEEVRSEASDQNGVIEVYPLTDPAADELMRQARLLEQQGELADAAGRVQAALEISPDDPEYWQYLAELDLKQERFVEAIRNAGRSFELGPQVGQLCYRNWLTLHRAYQALNYADSAAKARTRAEGCTVRDRTTY